MYYEQFTVYILTGHGSSTFKLLSIIHMLYEINFCIRIFLFLRLLKMGAKRKDC